MEISNKKRNIVITIIITGAFLASLGQSLLTSSVPMLADAFHVSDAVCEWITTAYILVLGVISALTAFLINSISTRKLFLGSMVLFAFGCVLSLTAGNFAFLLLSRIIQAVGAGVLMPLAQIVVIDMYPKEQHGRAFSLIGIVVAFAPALGPTLAGVFLDNFGWKSIFILLLVISLILIVSGYFALVDVGTIFKDKLDILSVIMYSVGFCLLMLGVSKHSSGENKIGYLTVIGVIVLILFILRSLKLEKPLLNLRLFGKKEFTFSFILISICYMASMVGVIQMPLYIQSARGISATVSGIVMLPAAVILFISNPIGGKLLDTKGPRLTATIGMTLLVLGNIPFMFFGKDTSLVIVAISYSVRAFGFTLVLNPLMAYSVGGLQGADVAHGNAIISSLRQMIGTLGSSVLVAIIAMSSASDKTDVHGINVSFGIQTVVYVIGLIIAVFCIEKRKDKD